MKERLVYLIILIVLFSFVSSASTCIDSDGTDYYHKGNVTFSDSNGHYFHDSCKSVTTEICDSSGCGGLLLEECSGVNCFVDEYVCDSATGGIGHSPYNCEFGCLNGACKNSSDDKDSGFTDIDGGINYYLLGGCFSVDEKTNITMDFCRESCSKKNENGVMEKGFESCSGDNCYVRECNCIGPGRANYFYFNCEGGCQDGACIREDHGSEPCTDSDDGINYYEKGICKCEGAKMGDGCINGGPHDGWLREIKCEDYGNGLKCQMTDYDCSQEGKICLNGICTVENSEIINEEVTTIYEEDSGDLIIEVNEAVGSTDVSSDEEKNTISDNSGKNDTREIKILVDQIEGRVQEKVKGEVENYNVTLNEEGNYLVKVNVKSRLFLIVPVKKKLTLEVNSENGEANVIEKPWWGFLAYESRKS